MSTDQKKRVDWHAILQDLFDDALPALSGYEMISQGREDLAYYQIDYLCEIDPENPYTGPVEGIRPLGHLARFNVFEFKFRNDILNENTFRYHCGRALMRAHQRRDGTEGGNTLTFITSRKPRALLSYQTYGFERLEPWKYRSRWIQDLDVFIIPLIELRMLDGGESIAYLQAIETNPKRQREVWPELLRRDLTGKELLKRIIMTIDEEALMSIAEEYKREGRREGKLEGRLEGKREGKLEGKLEGKVDTLLSFLAVAPEKLKRYETRIKSAKTLDELARLEERIVQSFTK